MTSAAAPSLVHAEFGSRVASVFAALGAGEWRVSDTVRTSEPGALSASDASEGDEEDEDGAGKRWREACEGDAELPSRAFCNALDQEDDADDADAFAAGETWSASLAQASLQRPSRHTAVPPDNPYERRHCTVYALDEPLVVGGGSALLDGEARGEGGRDRDAAWSVADALLVVRQQVAAAPPAGGVVSSARTKRTRGETAAQPPLPALPCSAFADPADEAEDETPLEHAPRAEKRFRRAGRTVARDE